MSISHDKTDFLKGYTHKYRLRSGKTDRSAKQNPFSQGSTNCLTKRDQSVTDTMFASQPISYVKTKAKGLLFMKGNPGRVEDFTKKKNRVMSSRPLPIKPDVSGKIRIQTARTAARPIEFDVNPPTNLNLAIHTHRYFEKFKRTEK